MSRQTRKQTTTKATIGDSSVHKAETTVDSKVLVISKTVFENDKDGNCNIVNLRNPKTGTGSMFLFSCGDHSAFQLMNFNEKHRSWFIGDKVQQGFHVLTASCPGYGSHFSAVCFDTDGSLVFVTPIDTLFLVLPYLKQSNKFRPLDQVIVDNEFSECVRLLRCDDLDKKIEYITDSKESSDMKVFCYNERKCLKWLVSKVEKLVSVLKEKEIKVTTGSQSATFVRCKLQEDSLVQNSDYLQYAHGLISDYLPSDVSASLRTHLGLSEMKEKVLEPLTEPAAKRTKTEAFVAPLEDYTSLISPEALTKKVVKLTAAQKALNKVDKSGMKSISSFFAKKT